MFSDSIWACPAKTRKPRLQIAYLGAGFLIGVESGQGVPESEKCCPGNTRMKALREGGAEGVKPPMPWRPIAHKAPSQQALSHFPKPSGLPEKSLVQKGSWKSRRKPVRKGDGFLPNIYNK